MLIAYLTIILFFLPVKMSSNSIVIYLITLRVFSCHNNYINLLKMTLFHKALHPFKEHFSVHQKKRANFKGKLSVWSWKKNTCCLNMFLRTTKLDSIIKTNTKIKQLQKRSDLCGIVNRVGQAENKKTQQE